MEKQIVRQGQVIDTSNYGKVIFERLDFYHGECTAKLRGITYPGTYYPKIEVFEELGFTVIDK